MKYIVIRSLPNYSNNALIFANISGTEVSERSKVIKQKYINGIFYQKHIFIFITILNEA